MMHRQIVALTLLITAMAAVGVSQQKSVKQVPLIISAASNLDPFT